MVSEILCTPNPDFMLLFRCINAGCCSLEAGFELKQVSCDHCSTPYLAEFNEATNAQNVYNCKNCSLEIDCNLTTGQKPNPIALLQPVMEQKRMAFNQGPIDSLVDAHYQTIPLH